MVTTLVIAIILPTWAVVAPRCSVRNTLKRGRMRPAPSPIRALVMARALTVSDLARFVSFSRRSVTDPCLGWTWCSDSSFRRKRGRTARPVMATAMKRVQRMAGAVTPSGSPTRDTKTAGRNPPRALPTTPLRLLAAKRLEKRWVRSSSSLFTARKGAWAMRRAVRAVPSKRAMTTSSMGDRVDTRPARPKKARMEVAIIMRR